MLGKIGVRHAFPAEKHSLGADGAVVVRGAADHSQVPSEGTEGSRRGFLREKGSGPGLHVVAVTEQISVFFPSGKKDQSGGSEKDKQYHKETAGQASFSSAPQVSAPRFAHRCHRYV